MLPSFPLKVDTCLAGSMWWTSRSAIVLDNVCVSCRTPGSGRGGQPPRQGLCMSCRTPGRERGGQPPRQGLCVSCRTPGRERGGQPSESACPIRSWPSPPSWSDGRTVRSSCSSCVIKVDSLNESSAVFERRTCNHNRSCSYCHCYAMASAIEESGLSPRSGSRRRTALALTRRMAMQSDWKRPARMDPESEPVNASAAWAMRFSVQTAEGPHPPDVSPTIGTKAMPCRIQSLAVSL